MKTRIVVHIALNAKGERVGKLFCCAGRFIPFSDDNAPSEDATQLVKLDLNVFYTIPTVKYWKDYCKRVEHAVRFQRVTLLGESNEN